ncbi:hypothetical protein HPB50_009122 [Hyalomma asiaticum]|uniref:Uncharacterized protein n=1 Tax=Hyalomma asiaticum TaxID=266040 RepID=A0ACB7RMG3_HYAAI|nr:hypothetical protein HPB50_009122 [Hyalomma asiaticum]
MAAAMCKCLVTHGDKNVVVPFVGPWKRAQLFEYLKGEQAFAGIDFGKASLTVRMANGVFVLKRSYYHLMWVHKDSHIVERSAAVITDALAR